MRSQRGFLFGFFFTVKFFSSAVVGCGFQSKGDPDCFILWALTRPEEDVFVPVSTWRGISDVQFNSSPSRGAAQGTLNQHPCVPGLRGAPRDSSGCTNQPKHPSATRALEKRDCSEGSEEH